MLRYRTILRFGSTFKWYERKWDLEEDEELGFPRRTVYEMCTEGGDESILLEMLDNPEVEKATSLQAIKDAIERGTTEELAIRLFGLNNDVGPSQASKS
jgi:hypothetical protein